MAFAISPRIYSTVILEDLMSGSPDYWTNFNSGTHSYGSSQLTVTDASGAVSRGVQNLTSSSRRFKLVQITWKYTSLSGTPIIFQYADNSFNEGFGCYIDSATTLIYARNGAGWTSTGQTLASNTFLDLEFAVDTTAGTYKLYMNGTLINTYTIDTTAGGTYSNLVFGGGSSSATWVAVVSKFLVKDSASLLNNQFLQFF